MGTIKNLIIKDVKEIDIGTKLNNDEGKIVQRYNIILGIIERYFIPNVNLAAYEAAHFKQDLTAQIKFGSRII